MDWLNDIKVWDDVLDKKALSSVFRYLSQGFYSLQRANDADACDKARHFLAQDRSEEEINNFRSEYIQVVLGGCCKHCDAFVKTLR